MAVALTNKLAERSTLIRTLREDESAWKLAGCGPNCRAVFAKFDGRLYPERIIQHDPGNHEAYGLNVLAQGLPTFLHGTVTTGALMVDGMACQVALEGRPLRLTVTELSILTHLAARAGQAVPHETLLRSVWGPEYAPPFTPGKRNKGAICAHILRVNIARIRRKLGKHRDLIATVPCVGFMLRAAEPAS